MVAQSALWVGLLYDEAALAAAAALVRAASLDRLRRAAPAGGAPGAGCALAGRHGARPGARDGGDRARRAAGAGAARLARDGTRSVHLAPLEALVAGAPTQAEAWLARFHGEWSGDVTRIFRAAAI